MTFLIFVSAVWGAVVPHIALTLPAPSPCHHRTLILPCPSLTLPLPSPWFHLALSLCVTQACVCMCVHIPGTVVKVGHVEKSVLLRRIFSANIVTNNAIFDANHMLMSCLSDVTWFTTRWLHSWQIMQVGKSVCSVKFGDKPHYFFF